MKKFLLSLAAVGLALVAAARTPAQDDNKPLFVVSLPSVDALIKDIGYLGGVAGRKGIDRIVEDAIKERAGGLKGLDRAKPIGLAISTDGAGVQFLGFVPASDAEGLLELWPFGVEDGDDGVKRLVTPFPVGINLKSKGGWIFLSNQASTLAKLPDDPVKLLDGIEKQYDIGMRVFAQNIPPGVKFLVTGAIRSGMERGLTQNPDESDEDFERRKALVKAQVDAVIKTIDELDKITLGWSVDAPAKKLVMEVAATAKAGTDTAKRYAAQGDLRSAFGGFWREDAVFSAQATGKITADEAGQLTGTLSEAKRAVLKEIDNSEDFENEAQKAKVKEVVGKVWGVLEGTIKEGQMDLGMVALGEGPFTFALGLGVADGAAADKALRDAIKIADDEGALGKVEYGVDKADDVTFHRITPPDLGDGAEGIEKVVGSEPKVVVATGKKSLYLAVGSDPIKSLKELIADSKKAADKPVPPGRMVLALAPIVKYVAKQDPLNPILARVAESVKPGSDRIRISSKLIPNGESSRIEVDEGVIKLIADAVMMYRDAEFGAAAADRE